jgi:sugar phosphate isomerase/epimerase
MRLGLNWLPLANRQDLQAALPLIDALGLGAIAAPAEAAQWDLERCAAFGAMVRSYGLVIGELAYWRNLLVVDDAERSRRIAEVRALLQRAEAMGAHCLVTLVGSFDEVGPLSPHHNNWGLRAQALARENCLRILDGLELTHTVYALEPWCNTFFHGPDAVRAFFDAVAHPRLALHLDQMNMHSVDTYYQSSAVIARTFDLLADRVASVHAKDLLWHPSRMFLHLDEVMPGQGVLDYDLFVRRLASLRPDITVYVEHWSTAEEHVEAIQRLRAMLAEKGIAPVARHPQPLIQEGQP